MHHSHNPPVVGSIPSRPTVRICARVLRVFSSPCRSGGDVCGCCAVGRANERAGRLLYLRWPHLSCLMFAARSDRGGWVHQPPCGAVIGKGDGTSFSGGYARPGLLALRAWRGRGRREGGRCRRSARSGRRRADPGLGRRRQTPRPAVELATPRGHRDLDGHVLVSPSAG